MAASATKTNDGVWPGGNGKRFETGVITYDSDATVEVPSGLYAIESASFVEVASGGSVDLPTIDETLSDGAVKVPASGFVTVDATGSNSRSFFYTFVGF
jgi:hypothetical protein